MKLKEINISSEIATREELNELSGEVTISPSEDLSSAALFVGNQNGKSAELLLQGKEFAFIHQELDPSYISATLGSPCQWSQTDFVTNTDRKFILEDGSVSCFSTEWPPASGTVLLDSTLSSNASQALADALWPFLSARVQQMIAS